MEEKILELQKKKEEADRILLKLEWVVSLLMVIGYVALVFIASYIEMPNWARATIIAFGIGYFIVGIYWAIKIEQIAGYYECAKCHHKYVPTYASVFWAPHIGRTRYMQCPECHKKSWNKKVISKEE